MENFVKLPIALLTRTDISSAAKVLYALMLDRRSLSVKNQWADSTGTYIYYTRSEAAKALNVSERQAQRLIKELTEASLIERKVQGRNKPYKIYVKVLVETKMSPPGETKMSPPEETKMSPEPYRYNQNNRVSSSSGSDVDELISSAEAQTGKSLSEEGRKKIRNAIAKNKEKIGNLQAYVRRCVINTAVLDTLEPEPAGYAPTYDIAEYESQSITDFMHSGEEPEPQTQKTENLTIPDQKL